MVVPIGVLVAHPLWASRARIDGCSDPIFLRVHQLGRRRSFGVRGSCGELLVRGRPIGSLFRRGTRSPRRQARPSTGAPGSLRPRRCGNRDSGRVRPYATDPAPFPQLHRRTRSSFHLTRSLSGLRLQVVLASLNHRGRRVRNAKVDCHVERIVCGRVKVLVSAC